MIRGGVMSTRWTHSLVDPIVCQAETILGQTKARNLVINPDLLGEARWEILLHAFIASGRSRKCDHEVLSNELQISLPKTQHWIERLVSHGMLTQDGPFVAITPSAQEKVLTVLNAYLRDPIHECGGDDGLLHFSSGLVPQSE